MASDMGKGKRYDMGKGKRYGMGKGWDSVPKQPSFHPPLHGSIVAHVHGAGARVHLARQVDEAHKVNKGHAAREEIEREGR